MNIHNRHGQVVQIPCADCNEILDTVWSYESLKGWADGRVLFASAWCPSCQHVVEFVDCNTLHHEQHCELLNKLCDGLEAAGRWLFTDEDRCELTSAPIRLVGELTTDDFLRQVAQKNPQQLLFVHTGVSSNACSVFLFVPGKPGPAFVPIVEVEAGEDAEEFTRRQVEALARYNNAVVRGHRPILRPCVSGLDDGFVLVELNQFGLLDEAGIERGIRQYLRYAAPCLAEIGIELVEVSVC